MKKKINVKRFIMTLNIVLLTASIVGGTVWYFMNDVNEINKKTIDSLQTLIDKLNKNLTTDSIETDNIKYPDVPIFYLDNNQIRKIDLKSGKKTMIADNVSSYNLSPDKTKIAYRYDSTCRNDLNPSEAELAGIHIFDIATNKDRLLKYYEKGSIYQEATWSPDGKYLVVDAGSHVQRSQTVIDSSTGKDIISFGVFGFSYEWINNSEIVFSNPQELSDLRPWGIGSGGGITIIDINNQTKFLKKATNKEDYYFIQLIDDKIYFSETKVESSEDWSDESKHKISYWTMDKSGNNSTEVEKIESLEDKVRKLLPSPYSDSEYGSLLNIIPWTNDKDWLVLVLGKKRTGDIPLCETPREYEIYIMDINNPKSIKKIVNGTDPSW